jgi:hypothetical protein
VGGDAGEQLGRRLDDHAAVADQVASAEHRQGIVGERRRHVATVRSAARSRNRRRPGLAWLLLVILLAVIALVARADATPARDPVALAIQYANALTGDDLDGDRPAIQPAARTAEDGAEDAAGGAHPDDAAPSDDQTSLDDAATSDDRTSLDDAATSDDWTSLDEAAPSDDRTSLEVAAGADEPTTALGPRALLERAGALVLDADLGGATALTGDELGDAIAAAGAAESFEARLRRHRASLLGRLELALAWREHASAPLHAAAHLDHELWLLATWRR